MTETLLGQMRGMKPEGDRERSSSRGKLIGVVAIILALAVVLATVGYLTLTGGPNPAHGDRPPIITTLSVDHEFTVPGVTLNFTASATDPDGDPVAYRWDLGDANISTSASTTHAYQLPGRYAALLTVSDGRGGVATNDASLLFIGVFPSRTSAPTTQGATGPSVAVLAAHRTL